MKCLLYLLVKSGFKHLGDFVLLVNFVSWNTTYITGNHSLVSALPVVKSYFIVKS